VRRISPRGACVAAPSPIITACPCACGGVRLRYDPAQLA